MSGLIRRRMPVIVAALISSALLLTIVGATFAHPLGNTSVNIYERIEPTNDAINVRLIIDIAELPALREKDFADTNDDGEVDSAEASAYLTSFWDYLQPNLRLVANDVQVDLQVVSQELSFPPGQGGLNLMRAVYELTAPHPPTTEAGVVNAELIETAFEGVPGWHEIIVRQGPGTELIDSSVPADDVTNELTVYPPDMLATPLSVRQAIFSYRVGVATESASPAASPAVSPGTSPTPASSASPQPTGDNGEVLPPRPPQDPLVSLLGERLTMGTAVLGILFALALGAIHAVSPGHGKTLVAAYVVGTRADVRKGVWLGLTVAITHTAGIFILGAATLMFTEFVVPERIVSWLSVVTGVLVVVLGAVLVWRSRVLTSGLITPPVAPPVPPAGESKRAAKRRRQAQQRSGSHSHSHPHPHEHGVDDHSHSLLPDLRHRDVAVLGIVGGLVPSGSALLLLLSAVALNEIAYGLLLIVAFGAGMAIILAGTSTGIALLRRSSILGWERWTSSKLGGVAAWLPTVSGLVVVGLGVWLTADALRNLR